MTKIKITQVKSGIDRPERQKLTLRALGLNKMNASREVEATAQILGMVRKVNHLITIEEMEGFTQAEPAIPMESELAVVESKLAPASVAAVAVLEVPEEVSMEVSEEEKANPEAPTPTEPI